MKFRQILWLGIIGNILFWGISFASIYAILTADYKVGKADIVYTALFHIPLCFAVVLNYMAFRYIRKNQPTFYAISFVVILLGSVGLHFILFEWLLDKIDIGFYFIAYFSLWQIFQFKGAYLIISLLVFLALQWFQLKSNQLSLETENNRVKLDALKAQVNPHFLINSLNNIYSLTKQNKKEANEYIVQLSDALRYMVYETKEESVLLADELEYLKNYVALEKLRLEKETTVEFSIIGNYEGYMIAPLILLSFIENPFKHYARNNPEIKIVITIESDQLHLYTWNTCEKTDTIRRDGGVGQLNAKKRLQLIYPNKHKLDISKVDRAYAVNLTIDLT